MHRTFGRSLMLLAVLFIVVPAPSLAMDPDEYPIIISPSFNCEPVPGPIRKAMKKGQCSIVKADGAAAKVDCDVGSGVTHLVVFESRAACEAVAQRMR